jgi:hypothetical protein
MQPKQKSSERDVSFAKGGPNKMMKPQAAGPQKPGVTAHAVKDGAPGKRAATGGPKTGRDASLSAPAKASHTAPPRKGR